jgi:hypothetical protein
LSGNSVSDGEDDATLDVIIARWKIHGMKLSLIAAALCAGVAVSASASNYTLHEFQKHHLTPEFWAEGAAIGDLNKDGHMDVVSGPFWYEGPTWKERHEYFPAKQKFSRDFGDGRKETFRGYKGALSVENQYSHNFISYVRDFNGDGWGDVLMVGFPGEATRWYENPQGKSGHWKEHVAHAVTDNESPAFLDLTGDGKEELVCNSGGYFGYASPDPTNPTAPWKWRTITTKEGWQRYTHGVGIGDVDGDVRRGSAIRIRSRPAVHLTCLPTTWTATATTTC